MNRVTHKRITETINSNDGTTYDSPATSGAFGHTRYVAGEGIWPIARNGFLNEAGVRGWDVSSNNGALPPRWAINTASVNESSLRENCFEKAKQLKADMLLNLIEAHQIYPTLQGLAKSLPAMAANWKKIKRVIKIASEAYLGWKFGVSPILSDIMATDRYLRRVKDDIKRYNTQDLFRYSSVARPLVGFNGPPIVRAVYNGINCSELTYDPRIVRDPEVRYVLVVKPTAKYDFEVFKALDIALSRFATSPADLAWELVPFSFVVDWLVDVRGALRAIDRTITALPYTVVGFTRSFSYELDSTVIHTYRTSCPGGDVLNQAVAGSVIHSFYERSNASVDPTWITWKPRFGKTQAALSAALISQSLLKQESPAIERALKSLERKLQRRLG